MPLDQFVQLTGAAAHAFAPEEPSGILGKSLSDIAGGAYKERMRREYEGPNELLKRTAADLQLQSAKRELEGQQKVGNFISAWPEREVTLKEQGKNPEDIDKAFINEMITTIAPYDAKTAMNLKERAIEAAANNKLKEYAQGIKDTYNQWRLDIANARTELEGKKFEEQKRHNRATETVAASNNWQRNLGEV